MAESKQGLGTIGVEIPSPPKVRQFKSRNDRELTTVEVWVSGILRNPIPVDVFVDDVPPSGNVEIPLESLLEYRQGRIEFRLDGSAIAGARAAA